MRIVLVFIFIGLLTACSANYSNQNIVGQVFPNVVGEDLTSENVNIPSAFENNITLMLIGYKQNSQFDIDRWLIALDMTETNVPVYEIPTIKGLFPKMFKTMINDGMRAGIPKTLWKGVITVYKDGEKIQQLTGNESPNNARVVLINKAGKILYFYDEGFSVDALNNLRTTINKN